MLALRSASQNIIKSQRQIQIFIQGVKRMTWYQSEQQQQEWRKLIEKQGPNIVQLMNSEQFCTQLTKNGNTQIMDWVQKNYVFFFSQLLMRCLVLPSASDSDERKFKQPTQAIYLICNVLDSISVPTSGLPTSSISGSMACSMLGAGGKVSSPQIIAFIIEKMFTFYLQNNPADLHNTLIPGYFNRIFQTLNRSQSSILINTLRTSQQGKLQKLLQTHGKFEQIIKCVQTILIVLVTQNGMSTNLHMSVNMPSPTPTVLPHPMPAVGNLQQPNHPYETKYRLLMNILQKVRNYKKVDIVLLENLIGIILEIMRNVRNIFEGSHLADYICQIENVNIFFDIGLGSLSQEGTQCQSRCLELLKYCMHIMSTIDRSNTYPKIKLTVELIIKSGKPTLVVNSMLELINQWFIAESSQSSTLFQNTSMNKSMNSSFSSSSSFSLRNSTIGLSSDTQDLLSSNNFFKTLLRMCVASPNCNIFHQRVANFISSVFKSQNVAILNSIFKENEIIKQTVTSIKDFKENPYFGYFIVIIEIYTTRRIETPIVKEVIQMQTEIWSKFYSDILVPHVKNKLENKLGEMDNLQDPNPLQFTVVKMNQKKGEDPRKQQQNKKETKINQKKVQVQLITPIQLGLGVVKDIQAHKEKQVEQDAIEPICLKFSKKQEEVKQQKTETQSFQSFLKKKMGEGNKLVDERRKSRTPTKMITGESKRKKWGAQNDEGSNFDSAKKSVSVDTLPKSVKPEQVIPKITFLKLSKNSKPRNPQKVKERKLNLQNDSHLLKWLERAKSSVQRIR